MTTKKVTKKAPAKKTTKKKTKKKDMTVPPVNGDVEVLQTKKAGKPSDDYVVTLDKGGDIAEVVHTPEEFKDLTGKQKEFVLAYCGAAQRNATKAAKIAGMGTTPQSNAELGHRTLRKVEVIKAMDAFMRPKLANVGITSERTLQHIADIAYSPWQDHIHVDDCGNVNMNINSKIKALSMLIEVDPNLKQVEHSGALEPHLHIHYNSSLTPEENRKHLFEFLRSQG